MGKLGIVLALVLVAVVASITTAKTLPVAAKRVPPKATVRFAAQTPDASPPDLLPPFVVINYPDAWSGQTFAFAAETSCYDHGTKLLSIHGIARGAGREARGVVDVTYNPISGDFLWKGNSVANNPSALATVMAAAALTVRNLVQAKTVIPDQIQ